MKVQDWECVRCPWSGKVMYEDGEYYAAVLNLAYEAHRAKNLAAKKTCKYPIVKLVGVAYEEEPPTG